MFKRGKFVFLFIVLNIFISYFATTFNEYVVNFNESFFDIFFSILGNVSILLLIATLGRIVFKSEKRYRVYLLIITFILNTFIFLIIYFTRNYKKKSVNLGTEFFKSKL